MSFRQRGFVEPGRLPARWGQWFRRRPSMASEGLVLWVSVYVALVYNKAFPGMYRGSHAADIAAERGYTGSARGL